MKISKYCIIILSLTIFFIQNTIAQKGWNKTKQQDALIYVPSDLKSSKIFKYTVNAPVTLNDQNEKTWLLNAAKEQQSVLGKPLKPWKVTPEKSGGLGIVNMYINSQNEKISVGYQSKTLSNGKVYMLQMITSNDVSIIMKYGKQIESILNNAENTFKNNPSLASIDASPTKKQEVNSIKKTSPSKKKTKIGSKEKRLAIEKAIRTKPGMGINLSNVATIWVDSGIDVLWGGIRVDTYIMFKDGTAYEGCEVPPNEFLIRKSKELQPKKWTKWRKSGSAYQILNRKKGTWKKLEGNRVIKTRTNEKLNKKYITTGGSQTAGSWKNTITFKPNGRFEMSNFSMNGNEMLGGGTTGPSVTVVHKSDKKGTSGTTVVSGGDLGGGTSSKRKDGSKNTGTYYLNGYTIILKHDNGYEHTELFFFDKADKRSFIYKDERYWIQKK